MTVFLRNADTLFFSLDPLKSTYSFVCWNKVKQDTLSVMGLLFWIVWKLNPQFLVFV